MDEWGDTPTTKPRHEHDDLYVWVSVAVFLAILIMLGAWYWQNSSPLFPKAESDNTPAVSPQTEAQPGTKNAWVLVSGNVEDTCSHPQFKGEVVVHGWYETRPAYGDGTEEVLHISTQDVALLPGDQLGIDYSRGPFVRLDNASPALVEMLRSASASQPAQVTLVEFSQYCEGSPMALVPPPPTPAREPTHRRIDTLPAAVSVVAEDSINAHWSSCGSPREAVFKITAIENGKVYWEGEGSTSGEISGLSRAYVDGLLLSVKTVAATDAVLDMSPVPVLCEN